LIWIGTSVAALVSTVMNLWVPLNAGNKDPGIDGGIILKWIFRTWYWGDGLD